MCLLAWHFKKPREKVKQRKGLVSQSYTGQNTIYFKESVGGFSVINLRLR